MPAIFTAGFKGMGASGGAASILGAGASLVFGIGLQLIAHFFLRPKQPKPSDGQVVIKESTSPRFRSYGRVKVAGVLVFEDVYNGGAGGYLTRVFAFGSGEIDAVEQHWLDDGEVTLGDVQDTGGINVITPRWIVDGASRVNIDFNLGGETPDFLSLVQGFFPSQWTFDHIGKGIPSAGVSLWQTEDKEFASTFPRAGDTLYRQVQRGAKVRRITESLEFDAPAWSDNAAAVIADYLTHPDGLRLPDSWVLNAAQFWRDAMTNCDDLLGSWEGGTEERWRIWNTYYFDERPADVLSRFLQACDGFLFTTPERGIGIKVGKWEDPTVTIDDDAILAFTDFGHGRDILTTANTIRARITNPREDYQEFDVPLLEDAADVATRGELAIDLELFPVPSIGQARRLMQLAMIRANPNWKGTIVCNLRALPAWGERFVTVRISELGVDEVFEILGARLIISEGNIVFGLELDIASDPYDDAPLRECLHDFQYYQQTPTIWQLTELPPAKIDSHGNYYFLNSSGLSITDSDGSALASYTAGDFRDAVNDWYGSDIETATDPNLIGFYASPIYSGQYVFGHFNAGHGSHFRHWWILFSPAADGSLTVVGAVRFSATTDAPFINGIKVYDPYSLTQPILWGGYAGLGGITFILGATPSIQDFIDNTYATGWGGGVPLSIRGAGYYPLGNTVDLTTRLGYPAVATNGLSRGMGFMLPDDSGNLFFYHYLNRNYITNTSSGGASCPEVNNVIKPSYPNGCIIRVSLGGDSYEDIASSGTHINLNTFILPTDDYTIDNANWQNPDGSPAIPFLDEYTYISTDEVGGADSYSMQIGCIHSRGGGTYWVVFYMTGYDDYSHYGNGEMYVRVKIFEYTPATQIGVLRHTGTCVLRTDAQTDATLAAQQADQFLGISISESGFDVTVTVYGPIYKTAFMLFSTN